MRAMFIFAMLILASTSMASQSITSQAYNLIGDNLSLGDCDISTEYIQREGYEALIVALDWSTTEYEYNNEREYTNYLSHPTLSKVIVKKNWWIGQPYAVELESIQPSTAPGEIYNLVFKLKDLKVVSVDFKKFLGHKWYRSAFD